MKKFFPILIASLILLSGTHLSIDSHFCGKMLTAVQWSFTGKKAACTMEMEHTSCPVHKKGIDPGCCHDLTAFFKVDSNYTPSSFSVQNITRPLTQVLYVPHTTGSQAVVYTQFTSCDSGPPVPVESNAVFLDRICVYRI